jgi:hypothetical protein
MVATFFHVLLGLAGLLLLYVGLFLTETEEGKLENRLEELWIRVDDLSSKAMTKQAVFLRQITKLVADGFASLFGPKLVSLKAAASCLCFALASLYLSSAVFITDMPLLSKRVRLICSLIFLVCGFSKYLRYSGFAIVALGVVLEFVRLTGALKTYQASLGEVVLSGVTYIIAILIAIGFVSLTRWSLRLASESSNTVGLVAIILANVASGAVLIAPVVYVEPRFRVAVFGTGAGLSGGSHALAFLIFFYNISMTNLFTAAAAFIVLLASLAAVVHTLIWPAMSRPVYAAQRYGLIRQHTLLRALGVTFLLAAWPNNLLVKAIAKVLRLGN